jgi:hypothetical protein
MIRGQVMDANQEFLWNYPIGQVVHFTLSACFDILVQNGANAGDFVHVSRPDGFLIHARFVVIARDNASLGRQEVKNHPEAILVPLAANGHPVFDRFIVKIQPPTDGILKLFSMPASLMAAELASMDVAAELAIVKANAQKQRKIFQNRTSRAAAELWPEARRQFGWSGAEADATRQSFVNYMKLLSLSHDASRPLKERALPGCPAPNS